MGKIIYLVGTLLLSGSVRSMLVGAGLGLATSQLILSLTNRYITSALSGVSGVGGSMVSFLGLAGADVALSIIIGAVIARATINSLKISLVKSSA